MNSTKLNFFGYLFKLASIKHNAWPGKQPFYIICMFFAHSNWNVFSLRSVVKGVCRKTCGQLIELYNTCALCMHTGILQGPACWTDMWVIQPFCWLSLHSLGFLVLLCKCSSLHLINCRPCRFFLGSKKEAHCRWGLINCPVSRLSLGQQNLFVAGSSHQVAWQS